jgi:two-component system, cell cycle sensor histidine kinase and response regulator CckA
MAAMRFDAHQRRGKESKQDNIGEPAGREPATRDIDDPGFSALLVSRILEAAGSRPDSRQLMSAALQQLRDWTGCEAGAIRLEEAGDYPYVVEQGFPSQYLSAGNSLYGYGPDGLLLRDDRGRPLLECTCGEIVQERIPPNHPRFTPAGTYWSGSISEPLPDTGRTGLTAPLRGCCAAGGYESVACLPLRAHGEIFGILQLNSKKKHVITHEVLLVLEPVVAVLATILKEQLANDATRDIWVLQKALFETMVEAFAYCRLLYDEDGSPHDWVYLASNEALVKLFRILDPVGKRQSQVDSEMGGRSQECLEMCRRVVATGIPEGTEEYFPKTGKWLSLRVSSPAPDHFLAVFEDISDRKQAEERLQRTQYTVDNMSDYLIWVDFESRILEVSESTCRHLEYSREELLGMTAFDIDPDLTPAGWAAHWQQVKERGSETIERRHRTKSGAEHPVEMVIDYVSLNGREFDCGFCRDISERKQLEESLRVTQATVDQAPDMILWMDIDGRLVYANESACRVAGRSLEEMTTLHIWELDLSFSEDSWGESWRQIRQGRPLHFDSLLRASDGRDHQVEVSSHHIEFEGREYGVAFAHDIEKRKRAEQVLRDSEERYRHLFELESDAILLTDEESGEILEANSAAVELYGYSRGELLTMNSADLATEPEPVPTSSGAALRAGLRSNRRKDGTAFPAEVRYRPFKLGRRAVRVAVVRDVTERVKAEEALRESRQMLQLVLDAVPLRVSWKDRDLHYMGCNKAMALDAHLPDPNAVVGLTAHDLFDALGFRLPPQGDEDDLEVIRTGVAKMAYEETVGRDKGDARIIRTSKIPLRDLAGNTIGILAVHEDVTERTMTLRALHERDEQLRHSQKMEAVGRLAGGIAHDFNNVLTTIIGYSDLILASPECQAGTVAEDVKEIKAAAERASGLTKQVLAFSRRQALRPEVLSVNRIISDIERMLARTIGADVELRTVLDPDLGMIYVDEHQFIQIALNLAVNARDAMPQGGVLTIETTNVELDQSFCETHPDAQPGGYVMVTVTDTGTGMDADTLAHVFEPFYTTKATGEGTGLGLAAVYGVVAQSGGYTYVSSELGRGTTFTIYLPRVEDTAPEEAGGFAATRARALGTILVVDDDDTFRALTVRILEKRGYRAIPASDGDQAVEILRNRDIAINLLLTDIVMPGSLQGDHVGQMAATLRPGLPVLYMSSYARDTIVRVGSDNGTLDYLEKPFTADSLMQRIRASIGRNQADESHA